jgi:hypothetical protein
MSYAARYRFTKAGQVRRRREGRCQRFMSEYIPWILVHEISSSGWSTRAWSEKMQRIVHLLSRLEYLYFLRLEFSETVREYYEQFVLPTEKTTPIFKRKGWRVPFDSPSQMEIPMTSDFLVIKKDGSRFVRSIKPEGKLDKERVVQKLEVERLYWAEEKEPIADWGLVTETEMSPGLDWNISWLNSARAVRRLSRSTAGHVEAARPLARQWILEGACSLAATAERLGETFGGLAVGTTLLRHLLAEGSFPEADFSVRFDVDGELPLLATRRSQ